MYKLWLIFIWHQLLILKIPYRQYVTHCHMGKQWLWKYIRISMETIFGIKALCSISWGLSIQTSFQQWFLIRTPATSGIKWYRSSLLKIFTHAVSMWLTVNSGLNMCLCCSALRKPVYIDQHVLLSYCIIFGCGVFGITYLFVNSVCSSLSSQHVLGFFLSQAVNMFYLGGRICFVGSLCFKVSGDSTANSQVDSRWTTGFSTLS